jgi:hypothetical protein
MFRKQASATCVSALPNRNCHADPLCSPTPSETRFYAANAMHVYSQHELTSSPDGAVAAWEAVDATLSPIIGHKGVAALFRRSAHLIAADYPWLVQLQESLPKAGGLAFQTMRAALAQQAAGDVTRANRLLLQTFREQLIRLIGEALTERLLRPVWVAVFPNEPVQESQP